jgi:Tol biopolymer transport system component
VNSGRDLLFSTAAVILTLLLLISITGLTACKKAEDQQDPSSSFNLITNKPLKPPGTRIPIDQVKPYIKGNLDSTLIVFQHYQNGNYDIYSMKPDGSGIKQLTSGLANDINPVWSPDRSNIAFQSDRDGNWQIYVMDTDGSGQKRITSDPSADELPTWSPDGTRLAFAASRHGNPQIYIMKADGSGQTRLTKNLDWYYKCPSWSPDGSRIAFAASSQGHGYDGSNSIYVMNADGKDIIQLTSSTYMFPAWSPDGSRIACKHFNNGWQIWVMNADGQGQTLLVNKVYGHGAPTWSPDSSRITFSSHQEGCAKLYLMNADGSELTKISDFCGERPCWSPFEPQT